MKPKRAVRNGSDRHPARRVRRCGAGAIVLAGLIGTAPAQAQQPSKPNILFILGDDIGWMQPNALPTFAPPIAAIGRVGSGVGDG